MTVELVRARLTHVGPLANNMRPMDRIEARAMGRSPREALRNGLRCSLEPITALDCGKPGAMMGVVPVDLVAGRGIVWLLGTEAIYRHGRELVALGPTIIGRWLEIFTVLENAVSIENGRAIRLLRRWGFTVGTDVSDYGGVPFVPFRLERAAIQASRLAA